MVVVRFLFHLHDCVDRYSGRLRIGLQMTDFPTDEEIRIKRIEDQKTREIAKQNATSDVEFLKLENPSMSSEEEADTWRSLYTFHLKKLKGEYPFNGNQ